ncbi:MAG: glycosyltransferase [Chthoniobacterales bacterium]|nr:glycosyltransferase [Chthoniobacterales bacterium]
MDSPDSLDHIAVVLCTRHRPPFAMRALDSILALRPSPSLVVIVDQAALSSLDHLREFDGRPGVLRIHDKGTGLARARNIGTEAAEAAGASIVAYTDDDCTVDTGWLAGLDSAFASAPDVALVFGTTKAAEHDREQGTIPSYMVSKNAIHLGLASKPHIEGMGACMAVRVDAWNQIGGFDEHLGAGTPLASAEENDLSIRLLRAGFAVAETPEARVVHHGFRHQSEVAELVAGYMRGSGAATAKMVRIGGLAAIRALAAIGKRWIEGNSGVEITHLSSRRIRLSNFLKGMREGFHLGIDPRTGRFLARNGTSDLQTNCGRP